MCWKPTQKVFPTGEISTTRADLEVCKRTKSKKITLWGTEKTGYDKCKHGSGERTAVFQGSWSWRQHLALKYEAVETRCENHQSCAWARLTESLSAVQKSWSRPLGAVVQWHLGWCVGGVFAHKGIATQGPTRMSFEILGRTQVGISPASWCVFKWWVKYGKMVKDGELGHLFQVHPDPKSSLVLRSNLLGGQVSQWVVLSSTALSLPRVEMGGRPK